MPISKFGVHISKRRNRNLKEMKKIAEELKMEKKLTSLVKYNFIDFGKRRLTNIAPPVAGYDATSKKYVDDFTSRFTNLKNWPGSTIDGNGKRLENFGEPIKEHDLTTRGYLEKTALCLVTTKKGVHSENKYNANSKRISNVSNPVEPQDAVTLSFLLRKLDEK